MSDFEDSVVAPQSTQRRPVMVYVICGVVIFGIVVAVPALWLATRGLLNLGSVGNEFYRKFGPWNYLGVFISLVLSVCFALSLFRLKRVAFHLAVALLLVNAVKTLAYVPALHAMGQSYLSIALNFGVALLLVFYVAHLVRTGVIT